MTNMIPPDLACVGEHLLLECYGPLSHFSLAQLENLMHEAAEASKAQVLFCHMHEFGPASEGQTAGVTGVLMLAESHISVHSWPEHNYAAFDIFMCRSSDPHLAADVIRAACADTVVAVESKLRGAGSKMIHLDQTLVGN